MPGREGGRGRCMLNKEIDRQVGEHGEVEVKRSMGQSEEGEFEGKFNTEEESFKGK